MFFSTWSLGSLVFAMLHFLAVIFYAQGIHQLLVFDRCSYDCTHIYNKKNYAKSCSIAEFSILIYNPSKKNRMTVIIMIYYSVLMCDVVLCR
jgi:hypothetical protein